jgi:hypothetical protein
MDEGRKRVLAIVAGIIVARHLDTAEDLFGWPQGSPRTDKMVAAAIRGHRRFYKRLIMCSDSHAAATALNYFAYNFIKIHRTLRVSPAMAAGVTDRLSSVEDLVALWEAYQQRRTERAA